MRTTIKTGVAVPNRQRRAGGPACLVPPHVAGGAIRSLGTPDFPAAFARMVGSDFGADQIVVFRIDKPGQVRTLLADSPHRDASYVQSLAERYTSGYWAHDPNFPLLTPARPGAVPKIVVLAARTEDLADGEYRRRLFTEPSLGAKASLIAQAPGHALYVNLYRGIGHGPFTPGELDGVGRAGDMLLALLERHFTLADDKAASDLGALQRVIEDASSEAGRAALSAREAAVCARIVAGYSTEGIGLDLGVSQHSVVSYRRRAFGKLGIATQRELFSLVLRRHFRLNA